MRPLLVVRHFLFKIFVTLVSTEIICIIWSTAYQTLEETVLGHRLTHVLNARIHLRVTPNTSQQGHAIH